MTAIWALLAQAIMISIGYTAACLAGATFATVAVTGLGPADLVADWQGLIEASVFVLSTALAGFLGALWPALVAIAVTEGFKATSLTVHLVAGCLVGLAFALPIGAMFTGGPRLGPSGEEVQLSVAAGAVGGLVYWAIAGRTAGNWLELRWFEDERGRR